MTVTVINVITSPQGGGAELLARELAQRLPCYGVNSQAVYFHSENELALRGNESVLSVSSRNPLAIFHLRKKIKEITRGLNGGIVVHAHLSSPLFYTVLACLGLNCRLVFTEHSTTNKRRSFPLFRYVERFFYGYYDSVVCISSAVKDSLSVWLGPQGAKSLQIINNGARIFGFSSRENLSGPIKLVSVGALSVRKGFDVAIKAVSQIPNLVDEYVIIGEGKDRERLTLLIDSLGLGHKIKLIGWSNNIEPHLQAAHIQLIPSEWEGFGLVAVEGMSTGLPIIASNVDGLNEVLAPETNIAAMLVYEARSAQAWAAKIIEMSDRLKSEAGALACSSRAQSEKFALDKMVDSYAKLYKSIVSS